MDSFALLQPCLSLAQASKAGEVMLQSLTPVDPFKWPLDTDSNDAAAMLASIMQLAPSCSRCGCDELALLR